jgi:hypothetical protein
MLIVLILLVAIRTSSAFIVQYPGFLLFLFENTQAQILYPRRYCLENVLCLWLRANRESSAYHLNILSFFTFFYIIQDHIL